MILGYTHRTCPGVNVNIAAMWEGMQGVCRGMMDLTQCVLNILFFMKHCWKSKFDCFFLFFFDMTGQTFKGTRSTHVTCVALGGTKTSPPYILYPVFDGNCLLCTSGLAPAQTNNAF